MENTTNESGKAPLPKKQNRFVDYFRRKKGLTPEQVGLKRWRQKGETVGKATEKFFEEKIDNEEDDENNDGDEDDDQI